MTTSRLEPDKLFPPGHLLLEELEARGMSQRELAQKTGCSTRTISAITVGKKPITATIALRFESALGTPARLWLDMEAGYQLSVARRVLAEGTLSIQTAQSTAPQDSHPVNQHSSLTGPAARALGNWVPRQIALINKLLNCPEVQRFDGPNRREAEVLANAFLDLDEEFQTFCKELLPRLEAQTDPKAIVDTIGDIAGSFRHMLYHLRDPLTFDYLWPVEREE